MLAAGGCAGLYPALVVVVVVMFSFYVPPTANGICRRVYKLVNITLGTLFMMLISVLMLWVPTQGTSHSRRRDAET